MAFAVFVFYAEPSYTTDLYRHYYTINSFRNGTGNLFENPLILFRLACLLISQTNNNGWLPCISVLLWGFFTGKILRHYISNTFYKTKAVLLYYLMVLGGCSVLYIVSGIRNTLVFAICCYAFYFYHEQHRRKFYIISLISCGIHVSGVVFIILTILYDCLFKGKDIRKFFRIILGILLIGIGFKTNLYIAILRGLPISYAEFLVSKLQLYQEYSGGMALENMMRIVVVITMAFLLFGLRKENNPLIDFEIFLVCITIAMYPFAILFERLFYAVSIMAFPVLNQWTLRTKGWKRSAFIGCMTLLLGFQLFYAFYSLFAHIRFNGTDYRIILRTIFHMDALGL